MIEIKEVITRKQQKEFVNFPLNLYKGNKYFVPLIYDDELAIFKKNYYYREQCDYICFLAYKDNKVVGRIQAIIQNAANKRWNQNRVRFTRFDSINDKEVSNALFDSAVAWAKNRGIKEIVGPLGFSDLEREGLLVEGFNEISTFSEQYNYEYYKDLVESYGFVKETCWIESQLTKPLVPNEKLKVLSDRMLERFELHFDTTRNTNEFFNKYGLKFFELLDKAYSKIYGTVPFTNSMIKEVLKGVKLIVNKKYSCVILDKDDNVVCFGIAFPRIGDALRKTNGKITPLAIIRLLHAINHPKSIELALIGVEEKYASKGVASALIQKIVEMLDSLDFAETNLNLEDNIAIRSQWKYFNQREHKKRYCYVKSI